MPPGALPHLKRRADFLRVAARRVKWAAPGLVLQAAPTPEAYLTQSPRVGFTSSRKVGNAVARNRARRRLRAAAQQVLPADAAAGFDLVLIARQDTLKRPFALLLQDLQTALKRVGALRERNREVS
ncbi:MAG TPA: ribonuclease P protein component [Rhodospirillaceae bacterium]|nr:ribonuclease P protein component [Rhodospirillaceae bacterium]